MERRDTIFTYSVVRSAAAGFAEKTPYLLALVQEERETRMALVEGYLPGREVLIGEQVEYLRDDERGNPVYRLTRLGTGGDLAEPGGA